MKTLADIFGVKIEKDMVKKRPMRVEDIDCSSRLEKYFKEHNGKAKHGNNEMREQFEKLPSVEKYLKYVFWNNETQGYCNNSKNLIPLDFASFLNGGLYAYQEQQKKIDKAIEYLDSIEGLVWYEQIKELLK